MAHRFKGDPRLHRQRDLRSSQILPPTVPPIPTLAPRSLVAALVKDAATQIEQPVATRPRKRGRGRTWPPPSAHSLEGLRPGVTDAQVGLLPGLRTSYMKDKYDNDPDKCRRAPPENLAGYTAEEMVERRKARAREYSRNARLRHAQLREDIVEDVAEMGVYRAMVEDAPHLVLVLSADLRCTILFANRVVARTFGKTVDAVLGSPLWSFLHPEDHIELAQVLTTTILTKENPRRCIDVRVSTAYDDFILAKASLAYGTQGIHCSMWLDVV